MRPARGVVAASVLASGLVLAAPAAPAVAADPAPTSLAITPYKSMRSSGERASFTVTLTSNGARLASKAVTFYTRAASATTWTKYVTRYTSSTGNATLAFYVRSTTYVRAIFSGDTRYRPVGSPTATVTLGQPFGTRVVTEASRHAGKPYQWGAVGPHRFDCSGFTLYVFSRFGKSLPHNSRQQYYSVRHVSKSEMRVGDLVFVGSSPSTIGHVGIYAGNGEIWHSPRSGTVVKRSRIWSSSYYVGRVA